MAAGIGSGTLPFSKWNVPNAKALERNELDKITATWQAKTNDLAGQMAVLKKQSDPLEAAYWKQADHDRFAAKRTDVLGMTGGFGLMAGVGAFLGTSARMGSHLGVSGSGRAGLVLAGVGAGLVVGAIIALTTANSKYATDPAPPPKSSALRDLERRSADVGQQQSDLQRSKLFGINNVQPGQLPAPFWGATSEQEWASKYFPQFDHNKDGVLDVSDNQKVTTDEKRRFAGPGGGPLTSNREQAEALNPLVTAMDVNGDHKVTPEEAIRGAVRIQAQQNGMDLDLPRV